MDGSRQPIREDRETSRTGKMSDSARVSLQSIKEQERLAKPIALRTANALASIPPTPSNLEKLIERSASRWYTSPELLHMKKRVHKLMWWISAGYFLGREIDGVDMINFFSQLVGDELTMSETKFKLIWDAASANKRMKSRLARGIVTVSVESSPEGSASGTSPLAMPCKSGKKCLNYANRKPAPAKGKGQFCSQNCSASDQARNRRLEKLEITESA
jgi:hypothetical protein